MAGWERVAGTNKFEAFQCVRVFREGAEHCARGGRGPQAFLRWAGKSFPLAGSLGGFGDAVGAPVDEEDEGDAGADGGVGDVEGGEIEGFVGAAALQVEMEEVDDGVAAGQEAVGEVADDAAEDEAEGELADEAVGIEMAAGEEEGDEGGDGDGGEEGVVAGEHGPGGAGVDAVGEVEEAGDDDVFIAFDDVAEDEPLGELVEDEDDGGQRKNTAGGGVEIGLGGGHYGRGLKQKSGKLQAKLQASKIQAPEKRQAPNSGAA